MMRIGIDAGGTKTKASLFQGQTLIDDVLGQMGNPMVDYTQALQNVLSTIDLLLKRNHIEYSKIEAISLGMAGASTLVDELNKDFSKLIPCPLYIDSDLKMSHIATFQNKNGILLIAGTGSAILGRNQVVFQQIGGWGHILGDEGSAYWIGLHILKTYVQYLDFATAPLDFYQLLPSLQENFPNRQAIIHAVYQTPKSTVAQLALYTTKFPDNMYLLNLCREAGFALARGVLACSTDSDLPIAFEGSLIKNNETIFKAFKEGLNNQKRTIHIVETRPATESILYLHQ